MAITWRWDEKCGEATLVEVIKGNPKKITLDLYTGNCYLILIRKFQDDGEMRHALYGFFANRDHMNRCLGIGKYKGEHNLFDEECSRITKLRINKKKMKYWKQIVPAFIKAFDSIEMEFYTE